MQATKLDLAWFRSHLLDEILPNWRKSITQEGLFLPHFNRQWEPGHRNYGTIVSQCRLLYNFSQGYALTGDPIYRNAVEGGTQFLLEHFWDKKNGGWYWSCGLDGAVQERRKDGYGHAFAIFGLSHAYHCLKDPVVQEAIGQTWDVLTHHFQDEQGGYYWRMTEELEPEEGSKSQNPIMHLFEALLAASTVGGIAGLLAEARTVGDFVLTKLVRTADRRLPEVYNADWEELPQDMSGNKHRATAGGRLDIGHAFEWAYLTSYATEQGLPAEYINYANSFMFYGLALGFDWEAGGIYSPASPTGQIINQRKGWWEQCEAIRAMLHFVVRHQRSDLVEPLQKTFDFVRHTLIDPEYGGWYQGVEPEALPKDLEKGSEWKVDYHVVGMCMEAIRLTDSGKAQSLIQG